jgi:hypothetical protein
MTFKELTLPKKLEHIWEYYKWVILGVLFVIIAGGSLFYTMVLKPQPEYYAGLAIYRPHVSIEANDGLTADLDAALSLGDDQTVNITNFYFMDDDSLFNNDMEQKFITYLYSLELNVVAATKSDFELFVESEYVAPLTDYYSEDELSTLDKSGLLMYETDPLDNTEKPFGINLKSSALMNKYAVFADEEEDAFACIVPVHDEDDKAKAIVDALIKSN